MLSLVDPLYLQFSFESLSYSLILMFCYTVQCLHCMFTAEANQGEGCIPVWNYRRLVSSLHNIVIKLTGVMEIWQEFKINVSIDDSDVEENIIILYGLFNIFVIICLFLNFLKKLYILLKSECVVKAFKNNWESWILSFLANFQLTSSPLTYNNLPGFFT